MKQSLSLLLLVLVVPSLLTAQIIGEEQQLLQAVESRMPEALAFLEEVVNINSGTLNPEGVRMVGARFEEKLMDIGFETRWVDMPDSMQRAGHLFAEYRGTQGKRLLLIGHLDTVFEEDSPFQTYRREGDTAYGPGVNDMKGGDVIMLYALKALHDNNLLEGSQIIVALHGDEERPGRPLEISRRDIIEAGMRSDIALGFETATGFQYATVARRGSSGWKLETEGKRVHSSGIFAADNGPGAVYEASRILHEFYRQLHEIEYLTFNPGLILGGTEVHFDSLRARGTAYGKTNVVSPRAIVSGDLRFITEDQKEMARRRMRNIVDDHLPHTSAKITFYDGYPAMPPTEGNQALLAILNRVSQDLGQGEVLPYDPGKRGAADISFVAQYVDGLDGLGAMGKGAHSLDETIDLSTFEAQVKRTALLIYRLTR